MPGAAFIIPTRNRPNELARTLRAIGSLTGAERLGGAEVTIADNGSDPAAQAPSFLANGVPVRVLRLGGNAGAAARNIAAKETDADWLVMLDDDSHPTSSGVFDAIVNAPSDAGAIGASIRLTNGRREAGGLPEVFVGCGVAIRRGAFEDAGGYDHTFQYYAEEYDLAAKLLLNGWRVIHDPRFEVLHEKSLTHRSMGHICRRLVRNNAWVAARYAPVRVKHAAIRRDVARYARIAIKENAMAGYGRGFAEMLATTERQPRRTMPLELWDRFVGLHAVREEMGEIQSNPVICIVDRGKNDWVIDRVIREFGLRTTDDWRVADAVIPGSCSLGPMLDACDCWAQRGAPVIAPWRFDRGCDGGVHAERPALTLAS